MKLWVFLRRLAARWPLVTRERMERMKRDQQSLVAFYQRKLAEKTENDKLLGKLLPKLFRVAIQANQPPFPERFRITVDFTPLFIREAFVFGNDQYLIEHVGAHVGRMVAQELRTVNFHRFADGPLASGNRATP